MRVLGVACAFLVVAATAAGQNLLTNGSFTGGLSGWNYNATTTGYDGTRDATGIPGSGSAKAVAPADTGITVANQCVAVTGSTQYKIGGKVLIPSGQASSAAGMLWFGFYSGQHCDSWLGKNYQSPWVTAVGSWTSTETEFVTSPPNAESVYVSMGANNNSTVPAADVQVNFDDVYATGGDTLYRRWIPAVIHKDVPSKNAKWRSDVAILNRSTSTANLTITMHLASGPVSQTAQLAGSSQLLQTDVAGWLGVTTDSGPLEVSSDQDLFLSGRTYNQVDATHTYGQNYEGEDPDDLLGAQESAWLPQLTENAAYRTNIGITNTGTATAGVELTLYDAAGNPVWQDTRDYAPGGFYQYQQPYLALGGIASGYAKVTVNSGSGVVAYASVTDNNTGDPTTITMKR
ncbi:MAG: hypothetical protein LAO05_13690 [Acidobacteriia bacterium]|nr:hypothetical protein [Terriglobia bacterium]